MIKYYPSQAIKIRNLLFTDKFETSIYNTPVVGKNILIDDIDLITSYESYKKKLNYHNLLIPNLYHSNDELVKIIAIANITDSVYNGKFSGGGTYKNLKDLEDHLLNQNRGGRCSDYSEYFLSQLILNGFFAREVSNMNHTAIEVYLKSLHKWIWVDSQFDIIILDKKNNILNALEISTHSNENLSYFSFNKNLLGFYKKFPECYTENKPFRQIIYSLDSRVFTSETFRKFFPNRKIHSIFMTLFFEKNKMIYNEK